MQKKHLQNLALFHDTRSGEIRIEGMLLKIVKVIHDKPVDSIMLNEEKIKSLQLISGMRQGCQLFPLLFNKVLEFLAKATR
jgi:hypothetical protein